MSGSNSSSDDSNDSRKRPPDEVLYPDCSPKRANCDESVHLKILVPSIAAGAVIGKSGEAIGRIQKDTNTKVKISKQDEFYPGTTERVCLIIGSIEGVMLVHNYVMDRIMEKPDPNPHATCEGRLNVERHKQVKILVPNSTAGMVIGKGGTYIQEIKEKTGAYVQISQKSREFSLHERCIIIAGDLDQTRAAVQLISAVIAADPQSASCPNLSYHDVRGPVASVYPTGSPYAAPVVACPSWLSAACTPTSPLDSTTGANAASMMAAAVAGAMPSTTGRNPTFGYISNYVPSQADLSSLAASLAASNPDAAVALGLLPSGGSRHMSGQHSNELLSATTPFATSPTIQPGTASDQMAMAAVVAQQGALLAAAAAAAASFQSKTDPNSSNMSRLTGDLSPSTAFLPHAPLVPSQFRLPSTNYISYQIPGLTSPVTYPGTLLGDAHAQIPSGASSTSSSPPIAASVALAALSGSATGSAASSAGGNFLSTMPACSLASFFGGGSVNQSLAGLATSSRGDPFALAGASLSPTSHSLLLQMSESLQTSSAGVTSPIETTGLVQQQQQASMPTMSMAQSPVLPMVGLYAAQQSGSTVGSPRSTVPPIPTPRDMIYTSVIAVPENVIGHVIGPQGRSIVDLQTASYTMIQISQKGVYVPGTQNRTIKITGSHANVQYAASLINQRVASELMRRESSFGLPLTVSSSCTEPISALTAQTAYQTNPLSELFMQPSTSAAAPPPPGSYTMAPLMVSEPSADRLGPVKSESNQASPVCTT